MNPPFTPEQFFSIFARYNESVWPMQVVLNVAAVACVGLLACPGVWGNRIICLVLSLLWAWMGIAYHFFFFSDINPAAWAFGTVFLAESMALAWFGVVKDDIVFRPVTGARAIVGTAFIIFALILYPVLGYVIGHRYPATPTFGLPCPTTIFTLGLLLFSVRPVSRWVFAVPLVWAAVGTWAAFELGVLEDLGLLAAGIATIAIMLFVPAPADSMPDSGARGRSMRAD